ncbi:hypothetical protein GCM10009639_09030 [Kitasatospora putterlickiae]|uniref:Uncharacterized protein n=1 Tax=Kitasatospora putterlickiae TaxID=221725 RepID=A0ABN1XNQ7_9ACTN
MPPDSVEPTHPMKLDYISRLDQASISSHPWSGTRPTSPATSARAVIGPRARLRKRRPEGGGLSFSSASADVESDQRASEAARHGRQRGRAMRTKGGDAGLERSGRHAAAPDVNGAPARR